MSHVSQYPGTVNKVHADVHEPADNQIYSDVQVYADEKIPVDEPVHASVQVYAEFVLLARVRISRYS